MVSPSYHYLEGASFSGLHHVFRVKFTVCSPQFFSQHACIWFSKGLRLVELIFDDRGGDDIFVYLLDRNTEDLWGATPTRKFPFARRDSTFTVRLAERGGTVHICVSYEGHSDLAFSFEKGDPQLDDFAYGRETICTREVSSPVNSFSIYRDGSDDEFSRSLVVNTVSDGKWKADRKTVHFSFSDLQPGSPARFEPSPGGNVEVTHSYYNEKCFCVSVAAVIVLLVLGYIALQRNS